MECRSKIVFESDYPNIVFEYEVVDENTFLLLMKDYDNQSSYIAKVGKGSEIDETRVEDAFVQGLHRKMIAIILRKKTRRKLVWC